jgi:hypothetical protein
MRMHRNALLTLALAALCATASAQSTSTTPQSNIGVSPSTAQEAMDKAVPRSDTATVTRTDESAADKARRATNATADAVTPGRERDTTGSTGSAASTTGSGTTTGAHTGDRPMRAARADRH